MIDVATLSVIRRWALREQLSIREIARRTGLSRNTIRKYLRAGEAGDERAPQRGGACRKRLTTSDHVRFLHGIRVPASHEPILSVSFPAFFRALPASLPCHLAGGVPGSPHESVDVLVVVAKLREDLAALFAHLRRIQARQRSLPVDRASESLSLVRANA